MSSLKTSLPFRFWLVFTFTNGKADFRLILMLALIFKPDHTLICKLKEAARIEEASLFSHLGFHTSGTLHLLFLIYLDRSPSETHAGV
jgi:hypothetical protein